MRIKTAATVMVSFACGVLVTVVAGAVLSRTKPNGRADPMSNGSGVGTVTKNEAVEGQRSSRRADSDTFPVEGRVPGPPEAASLGREGVPYDALVRRLIWAFDNDKLAELEKLADEAERHWDEGRRVLYFEVMYAIWRELPSDGRLGDPKRRADLQRKCRESMLDKGPATPLEVLLEIAPAIMTAERVWMSPDPTWPKRRREAAERVLSAQRLLVARLDPDFDPDAPPVYPRPPTTSNFPCHCLLCHAAITSG